jgi:hypothetical protein
VSLLPAISWLDLRLLDVKFRIDRALFSRPVDDALRNRLEAAAPAADASFSERVLYAALLEQAGCVSAAQARRRILGVERSVGWAEAR